MKQRKAIIAGLLVMAVANFASATTTIRITGSTAFRGATYTAIEALFSTYKVAYSAAQNAGGPNGAGSAQAVYHGTLKTAISGDADAYIKTSFSGSVGGVQAVDQNVNITTWLVNSTADGLGAGVQQGGFAATGANIETALPDVTMSDSIQGSTIYQKTSLAATKVGVVTFVWCKGQGSPSTITNMTPLLAQLCLQGSAQLSFFSQTSTDTQSVLAVGRDGDSGTRLGTFAESGFGILSLPNQFQINITSGAITSAQTYPPITVQGVTYATGNGGYSSGGSVATALNATNSGSIIAYDTTGAPVTTPDVPANDLAWAVTNSSLWGSNCYFVGYLGTNDAKGITGVTKTNGTNADEWGGNALTWNGVPFSYKNVYEGKYTFWTYEWLMYRPTFSGKGKTLADNLATSVINNVVEGPAGLPLANMHVERVVEGGIVTHL